MKSKLKHNFIEFLDQIPLWWLEILVTIVFFLPYFVLGDGCVFEINDQLDEKHHELYASSKTSVGW